MQKKTMMQAKQAFVGGMNGKKADGKKDAKEKTCPGCGKPMSKCTCKGK